MNTNLVSAVFDSRADAERAVTELRSLGVTDRAVSIIAQHGDDGKITTTTGDGTDNNASGLGKGLTIGAGVGALFGVAALAIPGIGPFIAAGALAEVLGAAGGAVAAGAIVGGAAGGLSGALMKYGVDKDDADYYEDRVNSGGVFVSVDTSSGNADASQVRDILMRSGGRSAANRGMATSAI